MLSYAKVIGRFSKLTFNLHKCSNNTVLRGVNHVRYKNTIGTNKNVNKTGVTATVEECTPTVQEKKAKQLPACEDPNYVCPPECEETCNTSQNDSNKPPCGGGSSWDNLTAYWKQLLAAVFLTGVTIYMVNKNPVKASKLGEHSSKSTKKVIKKPGKKIVKSPIHSSTLPNEIPYLLIGGGTAAFSAFRSIKSKDPTAKVLVINEEENLPYMRPPLSKELWYSKEKDNQKNLMFRQWNGGRRSLFYEPLEFYMDHGKLAESEKGGVSVATGWKVTKVDAINKVATLEDGYEIKYDKCLIATGAAPKSLSVFDTATNDVKNKIILYRTVQDFLNLEENLNKASVRNIVIIGGGLLGSELACSLVKNLDKNHKTIYQVVKEKSIMAQILPEYLSEWLTKKITSAGVHCISNTEIEDYIYKNNKLTLTLTGGRTIDADQIIVAVGVEPNTELSETSHLETDPEIGGYLVNAELQARTDLWVAGDAACFYDIKLGRRRVEHHDHAVISGRLAGENMTGAGKPYLHQSMFWSDLGTDLGYEAIGIVDSALPTVGVFAKNSEQSATLEEVTDESEKSDDSVVKANNEEVTTVNTPSTVDEQAKQKLEDYEKGVIFYLRENTIVGIVLWNIFNRMPVARQVLARETQYEDLNEVAKLFEIHED